MVKILLPVMAAFKDDVETMFSLLERTVGNKHEIGVELIGKHEHFHGPEKEEFLERIVENINSIAEGSYIVVHGFSGLPVYREGIADMRTDVGKELLSTYLLLGEKVKAPYIHVHTAAGYRGEEKSPEEKEKAAIEIQQNLMRTYMGHGDTVRRCNAQYNHEMMVGIENLPTPSTGDLVLSPNDVFRDYVETLEECCKVVKSTTFKITLDTCHYAADKEGEINLRDAITEIDEHTEMLSDRYLAYLHISDVSGFWKPNQELWTEGVIPGEGRIGDKAFKEFFDYVKINFPDIGICIEVANKDFKNPRESEESIKKVLSWLG